MDQVRLSRVADILEIHSLKARYCETVDALPIEGEPALIRLAALFTADVVGDFGLGHLRGLAPLIEFFRRDVLPGQAWMWHSIHTPHAELQADSATCAWTITARMKPRSAAQITTLVGRYHDEFRRTAQGWRISGIRFESEATFTDKYDPTQHAVVFGKKLAHLRELEPS
jgi:hypothetical protein